MQLPDRFCIRQLCLASLLNIFLFCSCSTTKQPTEVIGASEPETEQAIKSNQWIFIANQVMPQRGRTRMLNSRYTVLYRNDTLNSFLPYFGRAQTATIGETTSPLDFKSTDVTITKSGGEKGKWKITLKPNDYREVQEYNFTLFTNGSAQLNVQLTNRSPISFSGTVMPVK